MTPEELLDKCNHPYTSSIRMEDVYVNRDAALEAMKKYYNKAIDDAAENAKQSYKYYDMYDHSTMYNRWKDDGFARTDGDGIQYGVDVVSIDKESILKLKK